MRTLTRAGLALATLGALAGGITACDSGAPDPQRQDQVRSMQATGDLITNQPVQAGKYSPARNSLNQWVKTWESAPGKLAYTYLYNGDQLLGYYVLTGPPVSYAVGATQPYRQDCPGESSSCNLMPNPGQDGTFANQGTGQFQFYGQDAQTGRQLEWGGPNMSYLLSDRPLSVPGANPLGDAKIGEGKLAGR